MRLRSSTIPTQFPSLKELSRTANATRMCLNQTQGTSHKILKLEEKISAWIGKDSKMIKNQSGDLVFLSKDGQRRVRFDFNNPAPHKSPH